MKSPATQEEEEQRYDVDEEEDEEEEEQREGMRRRRRKRRVRYRSSTGSEEGGGGREAAAVRAEKMKPGERGERIVVDNDNTTISATKSVDAQTQTEQNRTNNSAKGGIELLDMYVSEEMHFDEDIDDDDAADRVDADTVRRLALLIKHFYTFVHGRFKLPFYITLLQRAVQLAFSLIVWLCIIFMKYHLDRGATLEILFQYLVVVANPSDLVLSVIDFPPVELFRDPKHFVELVQLKANIERFCTPEDLASAFESFVFGFYDFDWQDVTPLVYAFVCGFIVFIVSVPALILEFLNVGLEDDDVDSIPQSIRSFLIVFSLPYDIVAFLLTLTAASSIAAVATVATNKNENLPNFSICNFHSNDNFCTMCTVACVFLFLLALSLMISIAIDVLAVLEILKQSRVEAEAEALEDSRAADAIDTDGTLPPSAEDDSDDSGDDVQNDRPQRQEAAGDDARGATTKTTATTSGTAAAGSDDQSEEEEEEEEEHQLVYHGSAPLFVPIYVQTSASGKFCVLLEKAWTYVAIWCRRSYLTKMVALRLLLEVLAILTVILYATAKSRSVFCVFYFDAIQYESVVVRGADDTTLLLLLITMADAMRIYLWLSVDRVLIPSTQKGDQAQTLRN